MRAKVREIIEKSMYKDGKVSSSRIFSYGMMGIIMLFGIVAIVIELVNAIKSWSNGVTYIIPTEHIVILGMWLAHQLALLGIYKSAESGKDSIIKKMIGKGKNKDVPSDSDNV